MHARLGDSTRRPAAHGRPLSRTIDTNASALKMLLSRLRGRHFVGDALYIYLLQALNYGVPLLTLPYLLRVLGPQAYGSIALAQAVMGFALILTDYGFNLTAVRDISIARNDPLLVARVYWFTMATKVFLMACSVPALAALVLLVPQLRNEWPVFAACWTMVLGNVLFPQWYFQGVQRLREAVVMQVIARCAVTAAIFILVRSPADAVGAALLMSVAQVAAFLVAIAAGRVPSPKTFRRPSVTEVSGSLAASWHLIAGTMATTLYIQANPFVLGLLCGNRAVAFYSIGYSTVLAVYGICGPIAQSLFARASVLFAEEPGRAWQLVKRLAGWLLPVIAAVSLIIAIFAKEVALLLGGHAYADAASAVRIMAAAPFLMALATILGFIVMINVHLTRQLMRIYIAVGLLNVVLLPYLVLRDAAAGAAVALVVAETLGPIAMAAVLWRQRRNLTAASGPA